MLTRYDGMLLDFPVNIIVGYDQSITYLALDLWSHFGLYNYIYDITLIKSNLKIIHIHNAYYDILPIIYKELPQQSNMYQRHMQVNIHICPFLCVPKLSFKACQCQSELNQKIIIHLNIFLLINIYTCDRESCIPGNQRR